MDAANTKLMAALTEILSDCDDKGFSFGERFATAIKQGMEPEVAALKIILNFSGSKGLAAWNKLKESKASYIADHVQQELRKKNTEITVDNTSPSERFFQRFGHNADYPEYVRKKWNMSRLELMEQPKQEAVHQIAKASAKTNKLARLQIEVRR